MKIEYNNKKYTYISTIVKREYLYDGQYQGNTYLVTFDKDGNIEEIPLLYCKVVVDNSDYKANIFKINKNDVVPKIPQSILKLLKGE